MSWLIVVFNPEVSIGTSLWIHRGSWFHESQRSPHCLAGPIVTASLSYLDRAHVEHSVLSEIIAHLQPSLDLFPCGSVLDGSVGVSRPCGHLPYIGVNLGSGRLLGGRTSACH